MSKLAGTIAHLVRSAAGGRRMNMGLLYRGNPEVAEQIAADGHRIVVVGDRFRLLYRVHSRLRGLSKKSPLIAEVGLDALPIRNHSLDALILSGGLPSGNTPKQMLCVLRGLLKETGLLVWPHPVKDGLSGKIGRIVIPYRPRTVSAVLRHELSALAMESGFREVSQVVVPGPFVPWVVTTGRAGARPWEESN
ncbi:MAG: hypothetical protein GY847_04750 [Proteobacteria bacterium]|nr:hypothetical protein [Pseudomonadota bacterium]